MEQLYQLLQVIKLPKYRRISIMAFVYRSPRKLDQPVSCQHSTYHEDQSQQQNSIQKKAVGRIVKGIACRNRREEENKEKQFYFAKDEQLAKQMRKKQGSRHNEGPRNNKTQYFFKSKSKRGFNNQTNVDACKDKDEIQEEEDIIHKQMKSSKSKKKQKKKQLISPQKQQTKSQSPKKKPERRPFFDSSDKNNCSLNKQVKPFLNQINLLNSKKQLTSVFAVPSIPGKEEKFGYVLKQNMLHYPQLVPKSRFEGQKTDFPGPTDYQYTSKKRVKGVLKFNSFSKSNKKKISEEKSPKQAALLNDQQALKMHNEKIKQWVTIGKEERMNRKKQFYCKKKQREELETRDLSCVSDQSGQTEYQFDTTPGPGHYQYSSANQKKNFRSKNQKYSKIFMSQSSRFCEKVIEQKKWFLKEENEIKNQHEAGQREGKFFISKLKRDLNLQNKSFSPSPGHYDVRVSLQNDVITNIVKNSPKLFNNNLPRLMDPVISTSPGPAYYSQSPPNFKVESFQPLFNSNRQNQSKQESKLKTYEEILLYNCPRTNSSQIIHKKQSKRTDEAKRAPFLSSCPKNIQPNIGYITELPQAPIQSPYKVNKENMNPFNSSESKIMNKTAGYRAEVGLYTLENVNGWEKKSYNVIFN